MPDPAEKCSRPGGIRPRRGQVGDIKWLADQHGFDAADVAVIGDEINDVAMLEAAGCSVAMGNAIESVKAIAHHVTRGCDESGVAWAIERMLAGEW